MNLWLLFYTPICDYIRFLRLADILRIDNLLDIMCLFLESKNQTKKS